MKIQKTWVLVLSFLASVTVYGAEINVQNGETVKVVVHGCKKNEFSKIETTLHGMLAEESQDEFKVVCLPKVCRYTYYIPVFGSIRAAIVLMPENRTIAETYSTAETEALLVALVEKGVCAEIKEMSAMGASNPKAARK